MAPCLRICLEPLRPWTVVDTVVPTGNSACYPHRGPRHVFGPIIGIRANRPSTISTIASIIVTPVGIPGISSGGDGEVVKGVGRVARAKGWWEDFGCPRFGF